MSVEGVLHDLRMNRDFVRQVVAWEQLRQKPARMGELPPIHPKLAKALAERGIAQLFTHQTAAIDAVLQGENVVVATSTASGKTLCYSVPVLERLLIKPRARALYFVPDEGIDAGSIGGDAGVDCWRQAGRRGGGL